MAKTFSFNTVQELKSLLKGRFKLIHLPADVKDAITKDVTLWYQKNGAEWTNARLKHINQCIVNFATSHSRLPKMQDQDTWVASKDDFYFKGHWGALQKFAIKSNNNLQEVLKLINCYSLFTYDNVTSEMIDDFISEIEAVSTANLVELRLLDNSLKDVKSYLMEFVPDELIESDIQKPKDLAIVEQFKKHHEDALIKQARDIISSHQGRQLIEDFPILQEVLYMSVGNSLLFTPPVHGQKLVQGNINVLLEAGMKKRFVLDFYKPFEMATTPLGKRLYDIVRYLPWDSTFDEFRGYAAIQRQLKLGKTCYCFDLSSATDRFPYSLQYTVMQSLDLGPNYNEQLNLLDTLVQLPARLPDGRTASWKVGQPMGAFPSFAMFTLTHGLVLLALNNWQYNGEFVVHGDDVVIMCKKLAKEYKKFLKYSGVKCNMFKSIISNRFAEMNSKLITKDRIIQKSKWKPFEKRNILDHVRYWGIDSLQFVFPNQAERKKAELVCQLPGIFSDGSSMNPKGLSINERISHFENYYTSVKDLGLNCYETNYRTRIYKRFSGNKEFNDNIINAFSYYDLYRQHISKNSSHSAMSKDIPKAVINLYTELGPDLIRDLAICNPSDLSHAELLDLLGALEVADRTEQELKADFGDTTGKCIPQNLISELLGNIAAQVEKHYSKLLNTNETLKLFSFDVQRVVKSYQSEGRIQDILEFYSDKPNLTLSND